jgi:hypothetical protein
MSGGAAKAMALGLREGVDPQALYDVIANIRLPENKR